MQRLGSELLWLTASNSILIFVISRCQRPSAATAYTPMPQTPRTGSATGLPPVPVAVLLPRTHQHPSGSSAANAGSTWGGVDAWSVAALISAYSRIGDVVLTVGPAAMLAEAAPYLGRHPGTLLTDGDRRWVRAAGHTRRLVREFGAGIVFAKLPDQSVDSADLHATTQAIRSWRTVLRPDGYLLVVLTAPGPRDGRTSPRSNVIAAARTVGFTWQQEFLVPLVPPPEDEVRAMSDTAAATAAALVDGRHQPAHSKLLAFHNRTGGGNV